MVIVGIGNYASYRTSIGKACLCGTYEIPILIIGISGHLVLTWRSAGLRNTGDLVQFRIIGPGNCPLFRKSRGLCNCLCIAPRIVITVLGGDSISVGLTEEIQGNVIIGIFNIFFTTCAAARAGD